MSSSYQGCELLLATFDGALPRTSQALTHPYLKKMNIDPFSPPKQYNQFIRNKWHVFVMLVSNRDLIKYRKNNYTANKEEPQAKPPNGLVVKVKSVFAPCARSARTSDSSIPVAKSRENTFVQNRGVVIETESVSPPKASLTRIESRESPLNRARSPQIEQPETAHDEHGTYF